jgi:hypothetical protein
MKTEQVPYENISKSLDIPRDRYVHIVIYILRMLKDYRGDIVDVVKEIPLNLKGKERQFTMFVMGHSSSSVFSKMSDKQKANFMTDIMEVLKIGQEDAESVTNYMANETQENMKKNYVPTLVDIIKKIIDSNFTETEKEYLLFSLGLIYE